MLRTAIGNNWLLQYCLSPSTLEHRRRINSSISIWKSTFFQPQASSLTRPLPLSTEFYGKRLTVKKHISRMGKQHAVTRSSHAVLATDPSSQLVEKFNLDGNVELQVEVSNPTPGSVAVVNIQVTSSGDILLLHWGAVKSQNKKWILPQRRPVGTMVYQNQALRSPFVKSGSNAVLKLEIDDPSIQALEFLIFDESQNKWYKNNGRNIRVKLSAGESRTKSVSVPEDLVRIQAYLRWERKGKQVYTLEQEKEEYETARLELFEEIARGSSIQDLRTKLTSKNDISESKEKFVSGTKNNIPDDLVQINAFVRWEKAGKPNYSPEQQLVNFKSFGWFINLIIMKMNYKLFICVQYIARSS